MADLLFSLWLALQDASREPPDDDDDDDDDDDEGGGLPAPAPPRPVRWPPRIRLALPRSLPRPVPVPVLARRRA